MRLIAAALLVLAALPVSAADLTPRRHSLAYIFDDMVQNHAVDPELARMQDQALRLGDPKAPIKLETIIDRTIRQDALALLGK